MQTLTKNSEIKFDHTETSQDYTKKALLNDAINEAWKKISPTWPLKNIIACNPLQGFEDLPFQHAIEESAAYFQTMKLPPQMNLINRETIKWCQAFFDDGQATLNMPLRHLGLYQSLRKLLPYDAHLNNILIPEDIDEGIINSLNKLAISEKDQTIFFTLMLTTLPGWASYIKYRTEWNGNEIHPINLVSPKEYLALRLIITAELWPGAALSLIGEHKKAKADTPTISLQIKKMQKAETQYQHWLLNLLKANPPKKKVNVSPSAQLVFCIDVRSEPFRRALEGQGEYETYGFAGFFGLPIKIINKEKENVYNSCPVLLQPKHNINEIMDCSSSEKQKSTLGKNRLSTIKHLYQDLKYSFTTPFALVEFMGLWSGLWMSIKTLSPFLSATLKKIIKTFFNQVVNFSPEINTQNNQSGINYSYQCQYAESALRMIGLTENFSSLVVLCGHGSSTTNNAYATALDCGACGGHSGGANAKILAAILNDTQIRTYLKKNGIDIPNQTQFLAAEHNTTTDEVIMYPCNIKSIDIDALERLKQDLVLARQVNCKKRYHQMASISVNDKVIDDYARKLTIRSLDWAQTRPEWGLARNASFIIAPRSLTKESDLNGRSFLHSYNWEIDHDGAILTTIMTAPMVVAQWINSQYLFSSLENIAYGSGSKITQNITGKNAIMQGNASDLMHGLSLQSISSSDKTLYHEPLRLTTVIYAPRHLISAIISKEAILQKLFGNSWVKLICIAPENNQIYYLSCDLNWKTFPEDSTHHV